MHVLGLIDDRKALGPYLKLFVQLAVTTVLVVGFKMRALTALDGLGLGIWPSVVGHRPLDRRASPTPSTSSTTWTASAPASPRSRRRRFSITTLLIGQWFVAATLALLLGALLGFLCFNFPPAQIFMGDSGSLVIGFLLGVLTVRTHLPRHGQDLGAGWYAVFAPVIVLAVPLYDLIVVSIIRISRGKSPFVGDTNHFSHRLVARGMSRRTAVLSLYLLTAATSRRGDPAAVRDQRPSRRC